jgi:penicillin amidase
MPDPALTRIPVPGLQQNAEIVVDRWGIPHIRASSRHDVFFVQGFNAARERLWQLDTWRRRGLGRLAAAYGPGFLAQDRAARLFLYRGDMEAEYAAYGIADAKAVLSAFARGINAWIGLAERDPTLLAPEFALAGVRPERFAPADILRIRSIARVRNVLSEVARAVVLARAGLASDLVRRSLEPDTTPVRPEGLDLGSIPPEVLDVYRLATAEFDPSPERLKAPLADAWRWTKVTDLGDVYAEGSNNWVVAGARTATGRPILASDPHRAHALPGLRYIVHLSGPGLDVIGSGEPATPGVHIGHNADAAFALTIFPIDQEDLYVYETHPDDPTLYRYGTGWERMQSVTERVAVKGEADQLVVLRFTRHGPVLHEDPAGHRAYGLRTVWTGPGASPYMASLAYLDAATPEAYARALAHWVSPSTNHIFADTKGNIAWLAAGAAPIRKGWDGLLPVPGAGRYEWQGFVPFAAMPKIVNPANGFVATANEMNIPDTWDWQALPLGFEWAEHSRSMRVHEVLRSEPGHTLAQSMALQTDVLSLPARRVVQLLRALPAGPAEGRDLLLGWDCRLTAESAAAALYEVWWSKHLRPALLDRIAAGDEVVRATLVPGDNETLIGLMEHPGEGLADRDALIARTLAAAVADCRARLGEPVSWAWGRLHQGFFAHPLGHSADGLADVGPLPKGGSGSCVMNAAYRLDNFHVNLGASFRMVVDVGEWDNSRCINAPGQSGNPASPHYADLAPLWAEGRYVPMLFSRAAIDAVAAEIFHLVPAEA